MQLLRKEISYGIRLYLYEEETLSSYLHRVADLNYISYEDILRQIIFQSDKRFPSNLCKNKGGYRIDLLPSVNLKIDILAGLLKKKESELKRHTLFNLFSKFEPKDKLELQFLKMCSKIYNTKSRNYCPICIKKNKGIYKLQWQFLWNNVCEKHKCKLVTNCIYCNTPQKYIHPSIGKGLCSYCGKTLAGEVIFVEDKDAQTRCNMFMNDYQFLLSSTNVSLTKNCVSSREKSIVFTLLYAAQTYDTNCEMEKYNDLKFEREAILPIIKRDNLSGFIRIIKGLNNNFNLSFPMLYKYLKKINMSFLDFSRITVPKGYINSIYTYANSIFDVPTEKPKCKFEFCTSYRSEKMMLKQEREKIENKTGYYYSPYICLGCFIQYGYNKKKRSWDDIYDYIRNIIQTRDLISKGLSPYKISEITSYTIMNIYSVIGLLLRHSLLGSEESEKYMKKITPFDNINELFNEIDSRKGNRAKELIKKYHIHPINFYYHFFTFEVQKKLYGVKEDNIIKKSLLSQANLFIKECYKSKEAISIMRFCRENLVSLDELKFYDIYDKVLLAKVEQKRQLISQKENELLNDVKDLFDHNEGKVIFVKEVCDYLGFSDTYISRYLPNLYKEISGLCQKRKKDCLERKISDLKDKLKEIVEKEIQKSGSFPKIGCIIEELNLKKQFYRNYREVYAYCLELKQTFKSMN